MTRRSVFGRIGFASEAGNSWTCQKLQAGNALTDFDMSVNMEFRAEGEGRGKAIRSCGRHLENYIVHTTTSQFILPQFFIRQDKINGRAKKLVDSKTTKKDNERYPRGYHRILTQEFDPGSGRTLAACLTHASRTEMFDSSDILVANG